MKQYKQDFIEFLVDTGALRFGEFITKSRRKSPYYINIGSFSTGRQLGMLCQYYARAISETFRDEYDFLFGPSYKGIPLAVGVALYLGEHSHNVPFCFNRKEAKDHGEGGLLVGHQPKPGERALFIEDVTTAGTSIKETLPLLGSTGAHIAGLVIAVDRMERGEGSRTALKAISDQYGIRTTSIVTVREIMEWLRNRDIWGRVVLNDETYKRMEDYLAEYGGE